MSRFVTPQSIAVKVLSCDNMHRDILEAWKISRPEIDPQTIDFNQICKIDAPINDLAGILLHIRAPVLFREVFATPRDHTMWARTSRLGDLSEPWPVHESLSGYDESKVEELYCRMQDERRAGERQDIYRRLMPLSFMTEFVTKMTLRSAVRMIKLFNSLATAPAVGDAATQMAHSLLLALSRQGIPIYEIVKAAPNVPPATNIPSLVEPAASRKAGYIHVMTAVPMSLRAQIVRHRSILFTDGLVALLNDPRIWHHPVSTHIGMELVASVEDWMRVVSKRNCWIAQSELWSPLLNLVNPLLDPFLSEGVALPLPCASGKCHFAGDAEERLRPSNKDPGLPCPRHANLTQSAVIPDKRLPMREYVDQSERPRAFWNHEINRLFSTPGE
jgi:hypothetical protein